MVHLVNSFQMKLFWWTHSGIDSRLEETWHLKFGDGAREA